MLYEKFSFVIKLKRRLHAHTIWATEPRSMSSTETQERVATFFGVLIVVNSLCKAV